MTYYLPLLPWVVFVCIILCESLWPAWLQSSCDVAVSDLKRWTGNILLFASNHLMGRSVSFLLLAFISRENIGPSLTEATTPLEAFGIVIGIVLLHDLVDYCKHIMLHRIPLLWRLHQIHHSDLKLDFSTSFRFHPVEVMISFSIYLSLVISLGVPDYALLVISVLSMINGFFTHANTTVFNSIDRVLQVIIVTPQMHQVHHSSNHHHFNSNFGVLFSFWDKLFGTYKTTSYIKKSDFEQSGLDQVGVSESAKDNQLSYGVKELKPWGDLNILQMLVLPFRRSAHRKPEAAKQATPLS